MTARFNRTGSERKELVKAIEAILGEKAKYMGAPTMAYTIGELTVTRNGDLEWEGTADHEGLLEELKGMGFTAEEEAEAEDDTLTIEVPRSCLPDEAIDNLKRIIESKGDLMKHAFGADELYIEVSDEKVSFPWFRLTDGETAGAYTQFITALCGMARNQKRITAKPKENENEKYAFRCFLLRLGFIGTAFKEERKILLQNLSGNAAFPTQQAADNFAAKQKAKREGQKGVEA